MRILLGMTLGAVAITGLGACGQSEEAFRASYRTEALRSCTAGANSTNTAPLTQLGITVQALCECAIDRYMQATPVDQLRREMNATEMPAGVRNATIQCTTQLMRPQGGAATPALPSTEAPAAPAAPTEGAEAPATEDANATE